MPLVFLKLINVRFDGWRIWINRTSGGFTANQFQGLLLLLLWNIVDGESDFGRFTRKYFTWCWYVWMSGKWNFLSEFVPINCEWWNLPLLKIGINPSFSSCWESKSGRVFDLESGGVRLHFMSLLLLSAFWRSRLGREGEGIEMRKFQVSITKCFAFLCTALWSLIVWFGKADFIACFSSFYYFCEEPSVYGEEKLISSHFDFIFAQI